MMLFDSLGFSWNRDSIPGGLPCAPIERVTFRFARNLAEYVWDGAVLEGNPSTFVEVKTLVDGITVGRRRLIDQQQILNLADSSQHLLNLVRRGEFRLDEATFRALRERAAPTERDAARFDGIFADALIALREHVPNPFERGVAAFLFDSLQHFSRDGSRHTYTSRLMMNGVLMMEGIDAISIPAIRTAEFNSKMLEFYAARDATQMMGLVLECHPEFPLISELHPELSLVRQGPTYKYYRWDDPLPEREDDSAVPDAACDGREADLDPSR